MPELAAPVWDLGMPGIGQAAFAGGDGPELQGPFVSIEKK
jgi:hypothetical protein